MVAWPLFAHAVRKPASSAFSRFFSGYCALSGSGTYQRSLALAINDGLHLRQDYNREASRLVQKIGRYAHLKQFRRMRAAWRIVHPRVRRVERDIACQLGQVCLPQRNLLDDLLAGPAVSWLSGAKTRTSGMRCLRPE